MKINIILCVCGLFWLIGCQNITVGYLITETAGYEIDSLVIEKEVAGTDRERLGIPWTTTSIEGVEGTRPIEVKIKSITATTGDPETLRPYLTIWNDGSMEIPFGSPVIPGRYLISLTFANEGYSKDVDNCFTIIVE